MLTKTLLVVLVLSVNTAFATQFTLNFTADDFRSVHNTSPPINSITGQFVFEAANMFSDIERIDSVNLSIEGLNYTVADLISFRSNQSLWICGASRGGKQGFATDDFSLGWNLETWGVAPGVFSYTVLDNYDFFLTQHFAQFSITGPRIPDTNPIPEPATVILLGLGLAAIGIRVRWN